MAELKTPAGRYIVLVQRAGSDPFISHYTYSTLEEAKTSVEKQFSQLGGGVSCQIWVIPFSDVLAPCFCKKGVSGGFKWED